MADKVSYYRDTNGKWRWRRIASNGRIVADSGQGYTRKSDAFAAGTRVNAAGYTVEFVGDEDTEYVLEPPQEPPPGAA
jgi:uncharacterized protein YegP (UPF0339 family)